MSFSHPVEDNRLLAALAVAMVDHPRASLQELAKAVGISKATLYRFCRTREQLVERLMARAIAALNQAIDDIDLEQAGAREVLGRLTENTLEHRELTAFLMYFWKDSTLNCCDQITWERKLDAFFLRGQQQGIFRVDIPAAAMTEVFVSTLIGLVDAERRGRVARVGLSALVEMAFCEGAQLPGVR